MAKRQLVHIKREDWQKGVEFMRSLYSAVIPGSWQHFEKINADKDPFERHPDLEILADEYIDNMDRASDLVICVGDVRYQPQTGNAIPTITVATRNVYLPDSPEIERFSWYHAPQNIQNREDIDDLMVRAFGRDLENYSK